MQGFGIYDLVILALAVFLGWRLFSVLGTQEDHENGADMSRAPIQKNTLLAKSGMAKPVSLPQHIAPELRDGVMAIVKEDPGFTLAHFLDGAQKAYAMIVEAFGTGDVATLKPLLGDDVYEAFVAGIRSRSGTEDPITVAAITDATPVDVQCDGREARVTVRFASKQVRKDQDPKDAFEAIDIWTFRRLVHDADPNWTVVETRDAA